MGGEGHLLAMIRRDKDHAALKRTRRGKVKANQELYATGSLAPNIFGVIF